MGALTNNLLLRCSQAPTESGTLHICCASMHVWAAAKEEKEDRNGWNFGKELNLFLDF